MESATATYERMLPSSPAAAYLAGRAIDRPTAERFRLGYVEDPLPGHEHLAGRLWIPNLCAAGHPVGGKARSITSDSGAKYLGLTGLEARLFNLAALNEFSPVIVLTEGEIDAITVTMLGFPAVAIPGAQTWRDHHVRLFEEYDEVIVVEDADGTGAALAEKIARTDLPVRVVHPPGGKDVNECVTLGLAETLVQAIRGEAE